MGKKEKHKRAGDSLLIGHEDVAPQEGGDNVTTQAKTKPHALD